MIYLATADAARGSVKQVATANDGDARRRRAEINDHTGARPLHIETCAYGRRVRPFNEHDFSRAGAPGGVFISFLLQRRNAGRDANQQRQAGQASVCKNATCEFRDHLTGGLAIRDNPILDGTRDEYLTWLAAGY